MVEEEAKKAAEASNAWDGALGNVATSIEAGYDATGYDEAAYGNSQFPALDGSDTGESPNFHAHARLHLPVHIYHPHY